MLPQNAAVRLRPLLPKEKDPEPTTLLCLADLLPTSKRPYHLSEVVSTHAQYYTEMPLCQDTV